MNLTFLRPLLLLCFALLPAAAFAASSPWGKSDEMSVRLVAGVESVGPSATLPLGLEVSLAPGWHIYWRNPGTTGLPPSIEWEGSENLGNAEFSWPAPKRFSMQGLDGFGYEDHVVLPITLTPTTPGAAVRLKAAVRVMACSDICVPFDFDLALDLPAGDGAASKEAALLQQFMAKIPAATPSFAVTEVKLRQTGAGKEEVVATVLANPPLSKPDLFIEAGRGFVTAKPTLKDGTTLMAAVVEHPKNTPSLAGREVTLTLVDGGRATDLKTVLAAPVTAPVETGFLALLSMLGIAFIGGLILNLMPCVLPVISLKLFSVVSHSGAPPSHIRISFLATAAGILFSFLVLALGAVALKLSGVALGWGMQFQEPWFLVGMMVLLALFAANLWDLIHIPLPRFMADAINDRLPMPGEHDRTIAGNFVTGAFTTLLATPCSAPFVGTAAGFALAGSSFDILSVFMAMGLGLALPMLLVAAFPRVAHYFPRPGRWMGALRVVLGLALLGTALWLMTVLQVQWEPEKAGYVGGGILLGLFIMWLRRAIARPIVFVYGIVMMALLVGLGGYLMTRPESASVSSVRWVEFSEPDIQAAVASGKTVFVDVTAEWCLTCIANKRLVLDTPEITALLEAPHVIPMLADWTRPSDVIKAYLGSFGRYGIPFNAVYGPGAPSGIALPELLSKESVIEALNAAKEKKE